ncbi:MAG TPA: hypothetical protein VMM13_10705 [Euzebya sp.]|nr:hypothetical protein [Euzebya sp.]
MRAVLIWLALALAATACNPALTGATAQVAAGQVERFDEGEWVGVTRVGVGDRIRAVADAELDFGGDVMRVLAGSEATLGDRTLTLSVGDAMAEGSTLSLGVEEVLVSGTGAFRVQAGVTPRVAVYRGEVEVTRPGEGQRVAGLRELSLSSRRFDGTDQPLSYDEADPFDLRLLPDAIAFDAQIANLVNAIDAQFGAAPQPPAFYTSFVSVSEPDLQTLTSTAPDVAADGAVGPPADALIGLFLARAAADVGDGDLLRAGADIRRLRDEGARWGLVALTLGVSSVDFAGIVDRAVQRHDVTVAATTAESPTGAQAPTTGAPAPAPVGDPGAPPTPASPPLSSDPSPSPPPVDPDTVGEVLEDAIDQLPDAIEQSGSSG